MQTRRFTGWLAMVSLLVLSWAAPGGATTDFVALPESGSAVAVLEKGETYFGLQIVGWGPGWQYLGFRSSVDHRDGHSHLSGQATVRASGVPVWFEAAVAQTNPRQIQLDIGVAAESDTELTYVVLSLELPDRSFHKGKVVVEQVDGARKTITLPLARKGLGQQVRRFILIDAAGRRTMFSLDPPCDIPSDGAARIILAARRLAAQEPRRVSIAVSLPEPVTYYASAEQLPEVSGSDQWYPFRPGQRSRQPDVIGMQDWVDAPAGRHGRIQEEGSQLIYNGRPIKLWGINLCYGACAPEKKLAEQRAQFYARYGINAVRLHKFADGAGWAGIQSADSAVRFDPAALDRMDYFVAQLKSHGIFVALSAHFGTIKIGPADVSLVPYAEEFGRFTGRSRRITAPASAFFYSSELQELHTRQIVNLLRHRNPYTGLTYAEEPAVALLEIINEQSVMFYTSMQPLLASPTLRQTVAQRFCQWLKERYGSHDNLVRAWGKRAFDSFQHEGFPALGERLDKENILPLGNPWFWDPEQLDGSQAYRRRRLLDTLEFLYELQCAAYSRYVSAVRDAGYTGEIIGSNWQAGRALSHYYNLHSDYRVGPIDRHNYFGGGRGPRFNDATMLRVPGSGMLSVGMQQVVDRAFILSEWVHVFPSPWGVEGPALIGAYGLGLQDWDASFLFQNRDEGTFAGELGKSQWEVMTPQILGVFPAVARMVRRGDVEPSPRLAPRYVHVPSLAQGRIGFEDRVTQSHDVKTFDSDKVPAAALAVARCVIQFTGHDQPTPHFDLTPYRHDGQLVSTTRQLRWTAGQTRHSGFVTIDTPGTNAVVGFAEGRRCELSAATIMPQCPFAAIFLTARDPDGDLATSRDVLLVAMARARNTGMKVFGNRLLRRGGPPIRLEPVRATVRLARSEPATLYLLDHDGRLTSRLRPLADGTFHIDGTRDRTPYYLIRFGRIVAPKR